MPNFDPLKHHRRSIRLKEHDYAAPGAYFVTICIHDRENLLGEVVDAEMRVSAYGQIVARCWEDVPRHFENVEVDAFVVMPNHVHGVIMITKGDAAVGAKHLARTPGPNASPLQPKNTSPPPDAILPRGTQSGSLQAVLQNFKSVSARRINQCRETPGAPVWQRNYYEHVIRNESEWNAIRQYIQSNAANWPDDAEYHM